MATREAASNWLQGIVCVIGDHAGENPQQFFSRKVADIQRLGRTFWLSRSPKAGPELVRQLCETVPGYIWFISPAKKDGARATVTEQRARECSSDQVIWKPLPAELSPVTGKLDARASALVLDWMSPMANLVLDLWDFADFSEPDQPVRLRLGCSTVCVLRQDMRFHPQRIRSRYRQVVALGRLVAPFSVWVR